MVSPTQPCPCCSSTRFAHVAALTVLVPFVSAASAQEAQLQLSRRKERSGEALVCLGCGRIEQFMHGFDTLLGRPGVTEVTLESGGPYR